MKADSNITNVLECCGTYYNPVTKKWDSGNFTLNKNHIQFVCSSTEGAQFHLCLPLSTITSLEKRLSNFIYPALVIGIGAEKHWFGSFSNRDAVYNLLELFWRESLISKPHRTPSPPKIFKRNTSLGKELLGILNESKNTLIGTANALADQSRQLYEAEEVVEDLNGDLTKAEEAMKTLQLPLPFANLVNSKHIKDGVSETHRYKVTFSFSNDENKIDWERGTLVISNDVILLKVEEDTVMQVTKDELETLQVLSPWELCVTHTFSGIVKSCFFMCPQLSRLLKFISSISHYKEKIAYTDDDSSMYDTASCYSSSSIGSALNSPSSSSTRSNSTQRLESDSREVQVNGNSLSEEEIQELNRVLQNLQTLASQVGREQANHVERIDSLVENMETTELRMKKDEKSVKKMT